jgi:chaperonin GroEL
MSKLIVFDQEAKNKLKNGINKIANAVSVTLGPFGRNVLIEKEYNQVQTTKDGVTVAKTIELEDPIENMAATIIKQAAIKTVEQAGDGTTTSTVLARAMAEAALDATAYPTTNSTQMKRGMEEAVKEVVKALKTLSTDINDESQIKQIATLSANGDEEIGNLVAEAMDRVGRDGVVTVEESRSGETSLEIVEGIQFDRGYKSHFFVTDNNSMQVTLNDPYILIYDKRISAVKDLLPLLEKVATENKSLLIIAEDVDGEALATMVMNKTRGILNVCVVKAPDYGDRRQQILEDIAILTGGQVISSDKGMNLAKLQMDWLGVARVVTVNRDTTTIIDGKGDVDKISNRVLFLKGQLDKAASAYDVEKLQERLGKMVGGVAIINVGGSNEIEMKEKKDRLDDALQAVKSALDEGISPGAGIALTHARNAITYDRKANEDFNRGKRIVYDACIQPLETILNNAGEKKFSYLMKLERNKSKTNLVPKIGTNALVDAYESGIIDPTKVIRTALQNALGAATALLMTECVIYSKPEEKKNNVDPMNFM